MDEILYFVQWKFQDIHVITLCKRMVDNQSHIYTKNILKMKIIYVHPFFGIWVRGRKTKK